MKSTERMSPSELRASIGLAGIYGLRLLGMFVILPVFAVYAERLPGGGSHTLIGVALGIYGLAQALLQLPFGWLSDRFGRKRMLYLGLLLFAAGSFIAAHAADIFGVIIGRTLQGTGAISAVAIALVADLTRDEHRTKAMAMIGMTIGLTFAVSLVAGPFLYRIMDVPGIFNLTGVLALLAIGVVYGVIPNPAASHFHADTGMQASMLRAVISHPELWRLDFGIFVVHAVMVALFVVVPFALRNAGLPIDRHWEVYLVVMTGSFIVLVPAIIYAEKHAQMKRVFLASVAALFVAQCLLALLLGSVEGILFALLVFFSALNVLEAMLPSLVSKIAPAAARGTAIGVYSTIQFFAMFAGGLVSGYLSEHIGPPAVFVFCGLLTLAWLAVSWNMQPPPAVRSKIYPLPPAWSARSAELAGKLSALQGVKEAVVVPEEGVAYLKVNLDKWDEQGVVELIGQRF